MDINRFDALTRALAEGGTRRGLIRGGAASTLAWLGLHQFRSQAVSQDASETVATSPVEPICTCPEGLVLCQGLCVSPQDCEQEVGGAIASDGASGSVAAADTGGKAQGSESACPPQEKFCSAKGICVACPTKMVLDRDCKCICREKNTTRCNATCDCPKVATCNCVCPGPPCQSPKRQDAKTCKCLCPDHAPCPDGQSWDEQTCSCICPAGQQLCQRQCVACPPGTILTPETCVCACANATCGEQCCDENQVCDTRTEPPACCTPHTTCPLEGHCGFVSDNCGGALDLGPCPDEACHTGFCQPGDLCNACVYDEVRNGEQGPLCAAAGESCCGGVCCRSGQMCQNGVCCAPNETCPCARTCPPGQPLDPATCTCGCPKGMQRCQGQCIDCPGERCCLDSATCKCRCPECGANGVFDPATCGCVCAQVECPPNWGFDEASCTCVCSPSPCAPGSNWVFDQTRCSCVCQPTECPPNMEFNDASCSCLCSAITCPPNWQIDEASCACVCVPFTCPAGFQFDEASCSCVCLPPPCPPNHQMDMATCSCFCTEVGCAEGEAFDPGSCLCVPSDGSGEAEGAA